MKISIKFGKSLLDVDRNDLNNVYELKEVLAAMTGVITSTIKLISSGQILRDEYSLAELEDPGIRIGEQILKYLPDSTIVMIASHKFLDLNPPKIYESNRIINDLTTNGVTPEIHPSQRDDYSSLRNEKRIRTEYEFQSIEVLQGFPDGDRAREILNDLANDPPILKVMQKHKWSVGCLAEMYPDGLVGIYISHIYFIYV
jgi:hypothetical protein